MHSKRRFTCPRYSKIKDYRFFKAKLVFFVGRPETSPDSITQEWITTQRLIQKEASDKRDLVQTGQHLLKFMKVINSTCSRIHLTKCTFFRLVPFFSVNFQMLVHHY